MRLPMEGLVHLRASSEVVGALPHPAARQEPGVAEVVAVSEAAAEVVDLEEAAAGAGVEEAVSGVVAEAANMANAGKGAPARRDNSATAGGVNRLFMDSFSLP